MKPWHFIAVSTLAFASTQLALSQPPASADDDKAVLAAALRDFSQWKQVTYDNLKGVLALEPNSYANPDRTAKAVADLAPQIHKYVSDQLCIAYATRNRTSVPVYPLIEGLTEVQKYDSSRDPFDPPLLPRGAKAMGSVGLPGYSTDGKRALLQIGHSWSIHGAVVTYVLEKAKGKWRVVARDQRVFL